MKPHITSHFVQEIPIGGIVRSGNRDGAGRIMMKAPRPRQIGGNARAPGHNMGELKVQRIVHAPERSATPMDLMPGTTPTPNGRVPTSGKEPVMKAVEAIEGSLK